MDKNIKAVYFRVGKDPELGEMTNSVEGMQKAIGGGYVQTINIGIERMILLCDEEGLIKELPYNRGLRGDWLIVGTEEEEFISLSDEQTEWIIKNVKNINV